MRIGVYGAGAIGGYLGIALSAAGAPVTLLGRGDLQAIRAELSAKPRKRPALRPAADLRVVTSAADLRDVEICLVTVKSRDSERAGAELVDALLPDATVVSFQNGLRNANVLARHLGARIAGGVVVYNVLRQGAQFVQATTGELLAARLPGLHGRRMRALQRLFAASGERLRLVPDIAAVQAGKLLLNLNNGVCAATGLSIAASLNSKDARAVFAACIREGAVAFRAAGIAPARVAALPASLFPPLLALPDAVIRRLVPLIAGVDASARSSTLQDLDRGKPTEIDDLNGAVARLAEEHDLPAPANRAVAEAVHALERQAARGETLQFIAPARLRERARPR